MGGVTEYIYAIRNQASGAVKLGRTRDVRKRLAQLQTSSDAQLELLHYSHCLEPFVAEQALHKQFQEWRIRGEWFALPDNLTEKLALAIDLATAPKGKKLVPSNACRMNWTEFEVDLKEKLRAKRGSQSEVARQLGIKQPSVANYVSGQGRVPVEHIDTILDVLGLKLELRQKKSE